jgi:NAD-dependent deacetylase
MNTGELAQLIRRSTHTVVLTGAGISTAAGIPDFRGPHGIYTTRAYDPEKTFDIEWFDRDPSIFFAFARDFIPLAERAQPTFAHRFLAELERRDHVATVMTQNIDGLHQKAGSTHVLELHGSFQHAHCRNCQTAYTYLELKDKLQAAQLPLCDACGGVIKPDIVFYGEPVLEMDEAEAEARAADLFLVMGTSLTVYPAAMLPALTSAPVILLSRHNGTDGPSGAQVIDRDLDEVCGELLAILARGHTH